MRTWPALVTAKDLLNTKALGIRFLDASWYLNPARTAQKEFHQHHLPGALFVDIDTLSNKESPLPHMLPKESHFNVAMGDMGIQVTDRVVVYGGHHCFSAPRLWWTLKYFGHENVHVLNGGLAAWMKEGGPIEVDNNNDNYPSSVYVSTSQPAYVRTSAQIKEQLGSEELLILDARTSSRFNGLDEEPRQGVRSGHIPGSFNLPYHYIVEEEDHAMFQSEKELHTLLSSYTTTPHRPIVTTCGSGVTAACLTLALHHVMKIPLNQLPLYDGSWADWGSNSSLPIAK